MYKSPETCGVILAGGRSTRMGREKALLEIDGRPLIQRLADTLHEVTDEVLISASKPGAFQFLGLPLVPDVFPDQGPLSGIYSSMMHSTRELFLVLACDMPSIRSPLLFRLIESSVGFDAVVPVTSEGRSHPLCAAYRRTCLPVLRRNLSDGLNALTRFIRDPSLRTHWLDPGEGSFEDHELSNLNSVNDLERYFQDHP